jgi:hypothetical protein
MSVEADDDGVTIAAIGILAYVSADIAHHAFGHGGACLALGGAIVSLSSILVDCSLRGAAIDLAGPVANLTLGLVATVAVRAARPGAAATRLFWTLVAAFNLFWFALQLVFSVATRTDDWAWALYQFGVTEPVRYGLIVIGVLAYLVTIHLSAAHLAPFSHRSERARRIVRIVLLAAGATACTTAAFGHDAVRAILLHALPQSVLLPVGLLFLPKRAARSPAADKEAAAVAFSIPWVVAAGMIGVASITFLGPGTAIAIGSSS